MTIDTLRNFTLALALCAGSAAAKAPVKTTYTGSELISKAVHEVKMYSRYSIWDNIDVSVHNGNIQLTGQVSQPYKKADLQRIMAQVPGVSAVTNDLLVLPLSPMDDQLRLRIARAIYRDSVLSRYGSGPIPSIHIVVDNGHVTLEGAVDNEMDKNIAGIRAGSAGLSFGPVVNNLHVEVSAKKSHS